MEIILTVEEKEHSRRVKEVLDLLKLAESQPELRLAVVDTLASVESDPMPHDPLVTAAMTKDCAWMWENGYRRVVKMEDR